MKLRTWVGLLLLGSALCTIANLSQQLQVYEEVGLGMPLWATLSNLGLALTELVVGIEELSKGAEWSTVEDEIKELEEKETKEEEEDFEVESRKKE